MKCEEQAIKVSDKSNAVVLYSDGWYHYDETWSEPYGPFESEFQALYELEKYCYWLDNGTLVGLKSIYINNEPMANNV